MKTESSEKMDLCAFTQTLHNSQGGCASALVLLRLSMPAS